jgi:AcrR family transcriptional regulator
MRPRRLDGRALFRHPLAAAVIAVVAERGYARASVGEIAARAGVERGEFDRLFADKNDAVLRVFEAYIEEFKAEVGGAFAAAGAWPDSLRAAAYATTRWILRYPESTRFSMVSVLEAGDMALVLREATFRWCADLIDQGRSVAPEPAAVPESAALIAVGAVVEILAREQQGTIEAEIELVPQLMYGAVRPYLGEEAARRELSIPPPADLLS